jgi:hypothetical protein
MGQGRRTSVEFLMLSFECWAGMCVDTGMQESLLVLQAAFPIYIIVVLGAVLRRTRVLTPEMDKGIMTMTVHLLMPCLILDKMLGAEILRDAGVVVSAASVGFVIIAVYVDDLLLAANVLDVLNIAKKPFQC